jgi:hypothetical protein
MAGGELHEISAEIGAQGAKIDILLANQRGVIDQLGAINTKLGKVDVLEERVDRIEPKVEEHEQARQQQKGMLALASGVGSVIGATAVAGWEYVKSFGSGH